MGKLLRIATVQADGNLQGCGFKKLCVLTSLTPTEVPPSPPSLPPSWCCLKCVSPEGCVRAQGRRPEPTMTNCGNASKTCASIPQDTTEHNRRELVAFCQGCWHFTDFWHNKGIIEALELMTKLKIDAHKTANGTQGRLRGALTSQEIAKYVGHCLKPGKAPGQDKCPNELLKTMSDEEFLIVQAWVNEILTLPETTIDNARQSRSTMNSTISQLHKGGSTNKTSALAQGSITSPQLFNIFINSVRIGATKASRRSRCPPMPPLKVHHYRGEPRGRDCTYNYKNHSTA